jgi:Flp pilus assembly pilin Flp
MRAMLGAFRKSDRGQDLSEWCLLTALIALIAFGIFYHFSGGMQNLWGNANTTLATGNAVTSGTTGGSATGSPATASTPAH